MKPQETILALLICFAVYLLIMTFFYRWLFKIEEFKKEMTALRKDNDIMKVYLKLLTEKMNPEGLEIERVKREININKEQ